MSDLLVIHADASDPEFVYELAAGADALICDPPYSADVHKRATSTGVGGRGPVKRDLGFAPLSLELRAAIGSAAAHVRGYSAIFSDIESTHLWREAAFTAKYVRTVPWVRWSQPQITGDRPGSGCEMISLFHRGGEMSWRGPGGLTHFNQCSLRGPDKFSCEKPLDLMLSLVSWFCPPCGVVLDLTCGSGTTGQAARLLGRDAILVDCDEATVELAQRRVESPLTESELERITRWVATQREWLTNAGPPDSPKGRLRRAEAEADTAAAAAWLE